MKEQLHTCPKCGRDNFTLRGLKAHHCKPSPMPKPTPTSELETCIAGQPKPATMKLLRQVGEQLTTARVAIAIRDTETARANFTVKALLAGLLLLAKKQSLKHGQFQSFASELWSEAHSMEARPELSTEELHNFTRQLRRYAFLAQHFIAAHQQDRFPSEYRDRRVTPPAVSTEEILDLVVVGGAATERISSAITAFVAGRSLSRMLMDFRAAENASDVEEAQEAAAAAKRSRKKLPEDTPGQTLLNDILAPMDTIDSLMNNPTFIQHSTKEFWKNIADRLDTQAKQARALAREIA